MFPLYTVAMSNQDIKVYRQTVQRCWNNIKKYRFEVLFDKNARLKTRIGAFLSFAGFNLERFCFRMFFQ